MVVMRPSALFFIDATRFLLSITGLLLDRFASSAS